MVLLLFDRAQGWLAEDQALLASLPQGIPHLVVANKADQPAAEPAAHADVCISALTGERSSDEGIYMAPKDVGGHRKKEWVPEGCITDWISYIE